MTACVWLTACLPAAAQDDPRTTLRGLQGLRVVLAELVPELEARGITSDVVLAEVHLQLRKARIPILAENARKPAPGDPALYVEVLANVHPTFDQCSFSVRLEVQQTARLDRDRKLPPARVVTWSTGGIGEAGKDWRTILREELASYVGTFVRAYVEANPPSPN